MRHRNTHERGNHKQAPGQTLWKSVLKLICWLMQLVHFTVTQTARAALCLCGTSSPVMGGSPRWPWERDCVDALMFMFGRLAMMKECLFMSGPEGPLFNAPPFNPYAQTHTLPLRHTHSQCVCSYKGTHTHTQSCFYTHLGTYCRFTTSWYLPYCRL